MRIQFLIFSLFFNIVLMFSQEPPILQWYQRSNTFDNEFCASNKDLTETPDGGVVVVGDALPTEIGCWTDDFGNYDFWAMGLDSFGTIQWELKFGTEGVYESFRKAIYFPFDSTYVFVGYSHEQLEVLDGSSRQFLNLVLAKVDLQGDTVWTKTIPNIVDNIYTPDIINSAEGQFMVGTGMFDGISWQTSSRTRIINFDTDGNVLSDRLHGAPPFYSKLVGKTLDNKYIMSGFTQQSGHPNFSDFYLEKFDIDGTIQWAHYYEDSFSSLGSHNAGNGKILTNAFISGGDSNPHETGVDIISFSGQLDTIFPIGLSGEDHIFSIASINNRYFGAGFSDSELYCGECDERQGWVFEFDGQGNVLWSISLENRIDHLRINKLSARDPGVFYFIGRTGNEIPGLVGRLIDPSLLPTIEISGPDKICSFEAFNYFCNYSNESKPDWTVTFRNQMNEELWTINHVDTSQIVASGTEAGTLEICVRLYDQLTECIQVEVGEELSSESLVVLCEDECHTTEDGSEFCEEGIFPLFYTSSFGCDSTVLLTIEHASPISLLDSSIISDSGNSSGAISVEVIGGASPLQYLWNTGSIGPNIENISSGQYSLTITDANNCVREFEFSVPLINSSVNLVTNSISLYPNPVSRNGTLIIDKNESFKPYLIEFYSVTGQLYLSSVIDQKGGANKCSAPNGPGVYFVKIKDANRNFVLRRIIVL